MALETIVRKLEAILDGHRQRLEIVAGQEAAIVKAELRKAFMNLALDMKEVLRREWSLENRS